MTDIVEFGIAPLTLHSLQWGRVGASRVLLVHGVQSGANTWWQIADGLAAAGLHVTAPDLRGHGRSPTARRYRLADMVADLAGCGHDWDLVVGHSLGGTLVAYAAAHIPGFARHAVLLDPVFDLSENRFDQIVAEQLAELGSDATTIGLAHPGWHPEDARQKALAAAACSPYAAEAVLRENRPWDHGNLLVGVGTACDDPRRRPERRCHARPCDRRAAGERERERQLSNDLRRRALGAPRRPGNRPAVAPGDPRPSRRELAMPVAKGETIDIERTRAKLLTAATEVFYSQGTSVGVNELSQRAGVSKLSLYRHFGSKNALLEEVLRQRSDNVLAWLRAATAVPSDPVDRLLAVFDALRRWYAERPFRGCAIVNAAAANPAPDGPARRVARNHLARHLELLTALAAQTDATDPQLVGRQLLILLEGATVIAALTGDAGAASDAQQLARTLLTPQ